MPACRPQSHEFSEGQRPQICIARALATGSKRIMADGPVAARDVDVRSKIINLLLNLLQGAGLSMRLIAPDMSAVERMSHRIAVMHGGEIVETACGSRIFIAATHAKTRALLEAIALADPTRTRPPDMWLPRAAQQAAVWPAAGSEVSAPHASDAGGGNGGDEQACRIVRRCAAPLVARARGAAPAREEPVGLDPDQNAQPGALRYAGPQGPQAGDGRRDCWRMPNQDRRRLAVYHLRLRQEAIQRRILGATTGIPAWVKN